MNGQLQLDSRHLSLSPFVALARSMSPELTCLRFFLTGGGAPFCSAVGGATAGAGGSAVGLVLGEWLLPLPLLVEGTPPT